MDINLSELKNKRLSITWQLLVMLIFLFMITLGFTMRMNQADVIKVDRFYALMTLHGMGMAGILYTSAYAGLWFFLSKEFKLSRALNRTVLWLVIIGYAGFIASTLFGKFAAGWYILYPLPFSGQGAWPDWSTAGAIISIMIMSVGWLLGLLEFIIVMSKKYGLSNILGWQYLTTKGEPKVQTKPLYLITMVAAIPGVLSIIAGAWMLVMYLFQFFEPTLHFNPMIQKELTFFYGHTITNITIYMGCGWIYHIMPKFTGRHWDMDKATTLAWNGTLIFVCTAYFHHMYMDYAQPKILDEIGQVTTYLSAVPSTVVTFTSMIKQVFRSKVSSKWQVSPLLFFMGMIGWAIGGIAALLDTTIVLNISLHNTLWVPAHFHTYLLTGYVPMLLGFMYYLFRNETNPSHDYMAKAGFWIFLIGAFGFLAMFYLGGLNNIPRRYANYDAFTFGNMHQIGATLAYVAFLFIDLLFFGLIFFFSSLFRSLKRTWNGVDPDTRKYEVV